MDIKNVDLHRLDRDADEASVAAQLILACTDHDVIRRWKQLAPASFPLHWMSGSEEQLSKRLTDLRENRFAYVDQLQIHVHANGGALTPSASFLIEIGRELRQRGILFQVFPWESQDPTLYRLLMDLGAASFATVTGPPLARR